MSESVFKIHINKGKCNYDRNDDYIQQDEATNRGKQVQTQDKMSLNPTRMQSCRGEERAQIQIAQNLLENLSTEGC